MADKKYLDISGLRRFLDDLRADRPVIELTSSEYEALEQSGEIDPKAFYFITDSDVPGRNPDTSMSPVSTNTVQNKVIKRYVDSQIAALIPDTEMSDSSTNAVQNRVIKAYVDSHTPSLEFDTEMSSSSTNGVQNKVIKAYVDNEIATLKTYVDNKVSALRTELIGIINAIPGIAVSDTAPSDTSKVWIDTGAN